MKQLFIFYSFLFIFLFDNLTWFGLPAFATNGPGVYFNKDEKEVINFFKAKNEKSIAIGNEKNYELNSAIQLYSPTKGWIPHPFLTFDIAKKRLSVDSLLINNKMDIQWKNTPVYLYCDKKTDTFPKQNYSVVFENTRYKIFKVK